MTPSRSSAAGAQPSSLLYRARMAPRFLILCCVALAAACTRDPRPPAPAASESAIASSAPVSASAPAVVATASTSADAVAHRPVAELLAAAAADPKTHLGKKLTIEGVVVGPVKERVHDDHSEHLVIRYYDVPVADSLDDAEHAIVCEVLRDHPARLDPGTRVAIAGVGSDRDLVRPRALPFYLSVCSITRR
jgi:hypothetical protein